MQGKTIINYAPFIARVDENCRLINQDIPELWPRERFLQMVLGELQRLQDNENGYGPKGKNFIEAVTLPAGFDATYRVLLENFGEYTQRVG
jgi:hypothetical protein